MQRTIMHLIDTINDLFLRLLIYNNSVCMYECIMRKKSGKDEYLHHVHQDMNESLIYQSVQCLEMDKTLCSAVCELSRTPMPLVPSIFCHQVLSRQVKILAV